MSWIILFFFCESGPDCLMNRLQLEPVKSLRWIGDLVDYGPHPVACVEWMMDKRALTVSGNHDELVVNAWEHPEVEAPDTWRTENAAQLSPKHIDYLKNLPRQIVVELDGISYGMTHLFQGYEVIRSLEAFQCFSMDRFGRPLQRMIFGHTHRRGVTHLSDADMWINPGSVSYRRLHGSWGAPPPRRLCRFRVRLGIPRSHAWPRPGPHMSGGNNSK